MKPGDNLFEIETDKVSMEVPAIAAGTIAAIHVQAGEVAPVGAVVAVIQGSGEAVSLEQAIKLRSPPAKAGSRARRKKELVSRLRGTSGSSAAAAIPMEPFREVRSPERNFGPARLPGGTVVTPLARRLAGEAGIDLAEDQGLGSAWPHRRGRHRAGAQHGPCPRPAAASAQIVLTADIAIAEALSLCRDADALSLADVIVKAWAMALRRAMPDAPADIALAAGKTPALIPDAAERSLTAIAAARREASEDAQRAASAIFIAEVAGIASAALAVRPPQTTMLSIGSRRRAAIEAPDGSVAFADTVTATLACDPGTVDAAAGAELLATFKGFVERPVTMLV